MAARSKVFLVLLALAVYGCPVGYEPVSEKLRELERLPDSERVIAFSQLDEEEKIYLFFEAHRSHPKYMGLHDAIKNEGKDFLVRLRKELDARGGGPEVLSFLSVVLDMKNHGALSSEDIRDLRISGICQLAELSKYCPEVEAELLAP